MCNSVDWGQLVNSGQSGTFNGETKQGPCLPPSVIPPRSLLSLASFCPRCEVFFKARGAFGEGGNPVLPRRMGPRIREDDKIVSPLFPPSMLVPRILLSKMRGVLQYPRTYFLNARGVLRGALGAAGNPCIVDSIPFVLIQRTSILLSSFTFLDESMCCGILQFRIWMEYG